MVMVKNNDNELVVEKIFNIRNEKKTLINIETVHIPWMTSIVFEQADRVSTED